MTSDYFVESIEKYVARVAARNAVSGWLPKNPDKQDVELRDWLSGLTTRDKEMVSRVVRKGVDDALFGMFCVIDGARVIEGQGPKTKFELHAVKDDVREFLNAGDTDLHDLYNWYSQDKDKGQT